jgi:hypothetical protein
MATRSADRRPATRSPQGRLALVAAAFTALGAVLVLIGWATGSTGLTGGIPGLRAVNPNVAAGLLAVASGLIAVEVGGRVGRLLAVAAALVSVLLGAAALSAYAGGPGGGLDDLLFVDTSADGALARMAPQAAFTATVLGLALLVSVLAPAASRTLAVLTGLVVIVGATVLLGYLYGADPLFQPFGARSTAPFVAVSGLALAAGVYARSLPDEVWDTVTASTPTAVLLRRVLPVSLGALVLIGYLALAGRRAGLIAQEVEIAAVVVASGGVLLVLLLRAGVQLNRYVVETERARRSVDAANEVLQRQAFHLNDDVVQKLSTAWLAQEANDPELVDRSVRQAMEQAQAIAAELMLARARTGPVAPGTLVRADDTTDGATPAT